MLLPKISLFLFFLFQGIFIFGQTNFYQKDQIQEIKLFFSQPNWDYQLDTAKIGSEGFIIADSVIINGQKFLTPGVKYKGNSSYNASNTKNPLHIELDNQINQDYFGYNDIKLSTAYGDPSSIREVLSYDILNHYMHAPNANFATVSINDTLIGLFTNVESIDNSFYQKHFYSKNNVSFKCNPIGTPSPITKSNLKYLTADSADYYSRYEIKSDTGWSQLLNLSESITNEASNVEEWIDIDKSIWMLAFNCVMVNLDSYSGVFSQNYYLYQDNLGRFNPIIWDLNMSFGAFPFLGSGNSSMGSLDVTNMQQLPLNIHSSDTYWPLIKLINTNSSYKKMYLAHVKTILTEFFENQNYIDLANTYHDLISAEVLVDTNDFFTDLEFENSLVTNISVGSYTVPGIENLMETRSTYLSNTSELSQIQPAISNLNVSNSNPNMGEVVAFQITVNNASNVFFNSRSSVLNHFEKIEMYDDGLHQDQLAGDNVYGCQLLVDQAMIQYYFYAENENIGAFLPQRAAYEFYTLNGNLNLPSPSELVFNEIVASNLNGKINEYGFNEDWIELRNNTLDTLDLYGLYLTDIKSSPFKYGFPIHTTVNPYGFVGVWADKEPNSSLYPHANFNLSINGEKLYLFNQLGELIDSVSFGLQTTDVSMGRCPDGTGSWIELIQPSFMNQNCEVGIEDLNLNLFSVYPNPTNNQITVYSAKESVTNVKILDLTGKILLETKENVVNLENLTNGIYQVLINNQTYYRIVKH